MKFLIDCDVIDGGVVDESEAAGVLLGKSATIAARNSECFVVYSTSTNCFAGEHVISHVT